MNQQDKFFKAAETSTNRTPYVIGALLVIIGILLAVVFTQKSVKQGAGSTASGVLVPEVSIGPAPGQAAQAPASASTKSEEELKIACVELWQQAQPDHRTFFQVFPKSLEWLLGLYRPEGSAWHVSGQGVNEIRRRYQTMIDLGFTWEQIERGMREIKRAKLSGTNANPVLSLEEITAIQNSPAAKNYAAEIIKGREAHRKLREQEEAEQAAAVAKRQQAIDDEKANKERDERIKAENAAAQ